MTTVIAERGLAGLAVGGERFAVAWQHPVSRSLQAVGLLTCVEGVFTFRYLRRALEVEGFQPFLGFPDWDRRYESTALFPIFAQRVMRASRPDYPRYLQTLLLEPGATDLAILGRSQGAREGDGIRLYPEPSVDAQGRSTSTFFVNGLRHRLSDPAVSAALSNLAVGDVLQLVEEPSNPVDKRAILVAERAGPALGWVPNVLLDHVHTLRAHGEPVVRVRAVNGDDVPPGYRLLVDLSGQAPLDEAPFSGPDWAALA